MNNKIFIACDTTDQKKIQRIIKESNTNKLEIGYKFGLEIFFTQNMVDIFLSKINRKKTIFLDLKLNDIPNTCISALRSLKDIKNVRYLTVHINGGFEMIKAIKQSARKINKKLKILGVTVLTSFSDKSLKK